MKRPSIQLIRKISDLSGNRLLDVFIRHDFFISYRWSDGRLYALELKRRLEEEAPGVDIFLDSTNYAIGDDISIEGRRALNRSTALLLVASPDALINRRNQPKAHEIPVNDHVLNEVELFANLGRRVALIKFFEDPKDTKSLVDPTNASSTLLKTLSKAESTILNLHENIKLITKGPATGGEVLQRIVSSAGLIRQKRLRKAMLSLFIVALMLATAVSLISRQGAINAKKEAYEEKKIAQQQRDVAQSRRYAIESQIALPYAPEAAIDLAIKAVQKVPAEAQVLAAEQALRNALTSAPGLKTLHLPSACDQILSDVQALKFYISTSTGGLHCLPIRDILNRKASSQPEKIFQDPMGSPLLLSVFQDGLISCTHAGTLQFHDVSEPPDIGKVDINKATALYSSKKVLAIGSQAGQLAVVSLERTPLIRRARINLEAKIQRISAGRDSDTLLVESIENKSHLRRFHIYYPESGRLQPLAEDSNLDGIKNIKPEGLCLLAGSNSYLTWGREDRVNLSESIDIGESRIRTSKTFTPMLALRLWKSPTESEILVEGSRGGDINFYPSPELLATGRGPFITSTIANALLWTFQNDVPSSKAIDPIVQHFQIGGGAVWAADSSQFAHVGMNFDITIIDSFGSHVATLPGTKSEPIEIFPSQNLLLCQKNQIGYSSSMYFYNYGLKTQLKAKLLGHDEANSHLQLQAGGNWIFTGLGTPAIRCFYVKKDNIGNVANRTETIGTTPNSVAVDPTRGRIAIGAGAFFGNQSPLTIWQDLNSAVKKRLHPTEQTAIVRFVALHPTEDLFYTLDDLKIRVWEPVSNEWQLKKELMVRPINSIHGNSDQKGALLSFINNGQHFLISHSGVYLGNSDLLTTLRPCPLSETIYTHNVLKLSPNILLGGQNVVYLCSYTQAGKWGIPKLLFQDDLPDRLIKKIIPSADETQALILFDSGSPAILNLNDKSHNALNFSSKKGLETAIWTSKYLILGTSEGDLLVWSKGLGRSFDLENAPMTWKSHKEQLSLATDPSGRWLISGGWDTRTFLWDLDSQTPSKPVELTCGENPISEVFFYGDNAAAIDSTGMIFTWETQISKILTRAKAIYSAN